jgi:ankyrin repeat protein
MGLTPLHLAIKASEEASKQQHLRIVRFLLIRGADKGIKDQKGRTAKEVAKECKNRQN